MSTLPESPALSGGQATAASQKDSILVGMTPVSVVTLLTVGITTNDTKIVIGADGSVGDTSNAKDSECSSTNACIDGVTKHLIGDDENTEHSMLKDGADNSVMSGDMVLTVEEIKAKNA